MPWENVSSMEQKQQFVSLAGSGDFTVTELCGQFGISRKTGHKWLAALPVPSPTKRPRIRHEAASKRQGRLRHQGHF
jgi:transposase-like protein